MTMKRRYLKGNAMPKDYRSIWHVMRLLVIALTVSLAAQAEVIDKIVAVVNNDLILLSEVREHLARPAAQIVVAAETGVASEREALPYLIERKILTGEIQYLAFPKDRDFAWQLALQYLAATYQHQDAAAFAQRLQASQISPQALEDEFTLYLKGVDYIRRKYRFSADIDNPAIVFNLFEKWLVDLKAKMKIQELP